MRPAHTGRPPKRSFDERMEWATDLYARLAQNDQRERSFNGLRRG
jgi:hypothetical protein